MAITVRLIRVRNVVEIDRTPVFSTRTIRLPSEALVSQTPPQAITTTVVPSSPQLRSGSPAP